jgi:mRNA interferase HicA
MKYSEFKKQLAALGARFVEGTKHTEVYLNGRQTTASTARRAQDMGEGLRRAILRQLGVKQKGK